MKLTVAFRNFANASKNYFFGVRTYLVENTGRLGYVFGDRSGRQLVIERVLCCFNQPRSYRQMLVEFSNVKFYDNPSGGNGCFMRTDRRDEANSRPPQFY